MNWGSQRLRYLSDVRVSTVDKKSVDGELPVRLCNYTDVYNNDRITSALDFMAATASGAQAAAFQLHRGDSLITKDSETADDIGVAAYVDETLPGVVCGYHLAMIRPFPNVDPGFLNWAIRSEFVREQWAIAASGVTRFGLTYGAIKDAAVPFPPLDVQRRIADFLDDQVGRMDRALEIRRREVDLVEARRRASLTEIVFGDSVRRVPLGAVARVQLGRQRSPEHENGEFQMPYLRSANVTDGQILIQDVKSMNFEPADRRTFLLRVGDVLVTEGAGSPESVGASAVYRGEWRGAVCFQNTLVRLRPRGGVEAEYLGWWARAAHAAGAMRSYATGANILHIGVESLKRMPFPLRDERGQRRVIDRCDSVDEGSRTLHRALQASCDLLVERKRALITAVVTGEFAVSTASSRATVSAMMGFGGAE